jgi:ketosteroid isomerase-like protein
MKNFINNRVVFAVLCLIMTASMPLFAQEEWSAAQKDVWKNVEAYWVIYAQGDLEGYMAYIHTDFSGWPYQSALPNDKASERKWEGHWMKTEKILVYEVKPAAIQIHGNVAIVHYFFDILSKDAEGKERSSSGRWTDILIKQGDKWVMIGDHGGQTSKD